VVAVQPGVTGSNTRRHLLVLLITAQAVWPVGVTNVRVRNPATPLRELTRHVGSYSVTCHPAEATFLLLPQPKLVLD